MRKGRLRRRTAGVLIGAIAAAGTAAMAGTTAPAAYAYGVTSAAAPPAGVAPDADVRRDGTVRLLSTGPLTIRAAHSKKCLDVTGGVGALGDGVPVQQWQCLGPGQTNQQWYLTATGDGSSYYVTARHSGKCLDVAGGVGATANGIGVQQWQCLGYHQENQRWRLYSADGGMTIYLIAVHSGKCLDVTGGTGATDNGIRVQQWQCLGYAQTNQRWYLAMA